MNVSTRRERERRKTKQPNEIYLNSHTDKNE